MLDDVFGTLPGGVDEALALTDGVDDALVHGLARLDGARAAALESLAAAASSAPLGARVADGVGGIAAGVVTDEHVAALAGARCALLGAVDGV